MPCERSPRHPCRRLATRLAGDRRAATAIEYGFLVALIAIAIMAALTGFAGTAVTIWTGISDKVTTATSH